VCLQSHTKDTVLLMELCNEGSLQKMLSEPQHVFGLRETLFVSFFLQFGQCITFTLRCDHGRQIFLRLGRVLFFMSFVPTRSFSFHFSSPYLTQSRERVRGKAVQVLW